MKTHLLFAIGLLTALNLHAQECGTHIELLGKGIYGLSEAAIAVSDPENVDYIIAEAIYKSNVEPSDVIFSTNGKDVVVSPETVPISGFQNEGIITSLFRYKLEDPGTEVGLDILGNGAEFYSFALYVHRLDGTSYSLLTGDLAHVYWNEDVPHVSEITIPVSDLPRDINLRFGITELNADSRVAIVTFEANGQFVTEVLQSWEESGEGNSFVIKEMLLEDVPGEVDQITMTMISEFKTKEELKGDSYIAGQVVVDLPCKVPHVTDIICTYTQDFYGNEGGSTCEGLSSRQLLEVLLLDDLVMGMGGNTFTVAAGGVDCILDNLSGTGTSSVLSGETSCGDLNPDDPNPTGGLHNALLAQGIVFALNIRHSPNLLTFPVDGIPFVTREADNCTEPLSAGIPGTEAEYEFSPEVVDYLGPDAFIGDLLGLVNEALGGEDISPLSLNDVAYAAKMVNGAFEGCVAVEFDPEEGTGDGTGEVEDKGSNEGSDKGAATGVGDLTLSDEDLGLYPNPVMERFYLHISASITGVKRAGVYSMTGLKVKHLEDQIQPGADQVIEVDAGDLVKGFYFVRIETDSGAISRRFGVQ